MGLPVITGTNPTRINEFYKKLVTNIQTLESMGKEKNIRGYVILTLDKLPGIIADLVRLQVIVVEVDGIRCRALSDTGAESSYTSTALITKLNRKPDRREYSKLEMMIRCISQKIEKYKVQVSNIKGVFSLPTTLSKADKGTLLTIPKPRYVDAIAKYQHLKGEEIDDTDIKPELPIHVILVASEYAKIKTNSVPRVGEPGQQIAEFTSFSWTIMSPGAETNLSNVSSQSLNWFRFYLSDRKQQTFIDGVQSDFCNITCGIPKGYILGPLLFTIYINDLLSCNLFSKPRMYADDTTLTSSAEDPCVLEHKMNYDMNLIQSWLSANKLTLDVKKTKYMLISTYREPI